MEWYLGHCLLFKSWPTSLKHTKASDLSSCIIHLRISELLLFFKNDEYPKLDTTYLNLKHKHIDGEFKKSHSFQIHVAGDVGEQPSLGRDGDCDSCVQMSRDNYSNYSNYTNLYKSHFKFIFPLIFCNFAVIYWIYFLHLS